MMATTREELKAEIRVAFGSVPFPSHQGLRGSMALDSYATQAQVQSITASQDIHGEWWQIPHDELRYGVLGLSYLDAAGVLFYLPAYLDMALEDVRKKRLWVLDLMELDDEPGLRSYMQERLSRLNDTQRRACVQTLKFLRLQLVEDPFGEHQHERDRIDRILNDSYWQNAENGSVAKR